MRVINEIKIAIEIHAKWLAETIDKIRVEMELYRYKCKLKIELTGADSSDMR